MFSEEEAAGKWCPFARITHARNDAASAYNRVIGSGGVEHLARCIASKCMAWEWQQPKDEVHRADKYRYAAPTLDGGPSPPTPPPEGDGWVMKDNSPAATVWTRPRINRTGLCGLAVPRLAEVSVSS